MATTLETALALKLTGTYTTPQDLNADAVARLSAAFSDGLATGTSADQADLIWYDERTLAATSENLDLAAITDAFGAAKKFAKVKALLVKNKNTTTGHILSLGGATASALANWIASTTDIVKLGPDGVFLAWDPKDGYAVNTTTAKLLKIDAGTVTMTYDIIIVGVAA
jgi:3-phosphoglycerate kinase